MLDSLLYDLLEKSYFFPLRDKIENENSLERNWVEEAKPKIEHTLNEQQKELLAHYVIAVENKTDFLHIEMEKHALNLGIKIGMELQEFLNKLAE